MASGALFGTTVTGPGSTHGAKHLVEVKAGRMTLKGKMVHADKRKGLLYVYQSDDSLMHFCWKDRTSGEVEDDLIIFADDCEYVRVPQCKDGRVYLLKFKLSNRRFFFWLQEPKTEKDEEYCKKINDLLNNPPIMGGGGTSSTSNANNDLSRADQDLQSLLSSMSQTQIMQLFGGMGPGLSNLLSPSGGVGRGNSFPWIRNQTPTTTASGTKPTGSTPSSATATSTTEASPAVDLARSLTSELVSSAITNDADMEELAKHLPPVDDADKSGDVKDQVKATVSSPQFQQAVTMFSTAFQYGDLGPIVTQLAADNQQAVQAANKGDMKAFLQALQTTDKSDEAMDQEPSGTEPASSTGNKDDDGEESMHFD